MTMLRLFLNWEKHNQVFQLCYDSYNQTKLHFPIAILFGFNVSEQSYRN